MIGVLCLRILLVALAVNCFSLLGRSTDRAISPLPQPVANWRIELIAEAPRVQHPTVVACAPDGRVFVAEDPMDIRLAKADAAGGRILCFYPDGHFTVFADKLYAVFGLQYLDGKVYVLHNPKLSVFDDTNGIGSNRRELIDQTLPEPSALNWNDHVPANFHLAMDGFFYVASGDKGLHGAKGTDGSRADLFTGGLFRIRPDGSELEIVSHGVRNILDVALNAEDERFTYDNTDEHDWMGRFTHMVDAGFYGYPHDFIPQRPYTLWMMDDYGAGAACGISAYTEDALPPEYQGNIFLSDFGKRQILRVRIERSGASFRTLSKEDIFPNPPADFRPVGITPGSDGKSLYICDWQHRDEKADVSVGRLLKLTWTGPDASTPKPSWYIPAATGSKFHATDSELGRGLSHPSREVRLTAQRRLTERRATTEVTAILRNTSASALARSHALWAIDAIEGNRSDSAEIIAAAADQNPIVRRQVLRQLGTRRVTNAALAIIERLGDSDTSVRFQAATALGRLGDPKNVSAVRSALAGSDLFLRYALFTALNRIGTNAPKAWPEIVLGLESSNSRVREDTYFALRETYDRTLLAALIALFLDANKPSTARQSALELIAALHHQKPAWKGQWWAYHPALQQPAAKSEVWSGTDLILATLRAGLHESDLRLRRDCINGLATALDTNSAPSLLEIFPRETDATNRATLLRALGKMKIPETLRLITNELDQPSHSETTSAAITAAGELSNPKAVTPLTRFLQSPKALAPSLAQAIIALRKLQAISSISSIEPLTRHAVASVRVEAFTALAELQGEASLPSLETGLKDSSPEIRRAVVTALGNLKSSRTVPLLLQAYLDPVVRTEAFAALTRSGDQRAIGVFLAGIGSKNPLERNAAHLAIGEMRGKVLKAVEAKVSTLSSQALTELRHIYAGNTLAESGPIFAKEFKQPTLDQYLAAAVKLPGNRVRGKELFAETAGLNCIACHRRDGQGGDLGPDLSGIGSQFDRRSLAESILYPSKAVREGYQQIVVEMTDAEQFIGLVRGETAEVLTLRDSSGREHKLPRTSIKSRHNSEFSLMPEGLQAALTIDEFSDLIAYLASLLANSPSTLIK